MTEEQRIDDSAPDPDPAAPDTAADPFAGPDWEQPPLTGERGAAAGRRVKVSRRKKRTLRRRRRIGLVMLVLGALIVLAGAWLIVTGLMARSQLDQVRAEVHRLRSQISAGDLSAARVTAAQVRGHAHRAHNLTTGPVWALAAELPGGGEPVRTIRGITAGLDVLGENVLPQLVDASEHLDPHKLRQSDGSIDLAPIAAVVPVLDRASTVMATVSNSVRGLPGHTWLSSIDSARSDALTQLASFTRTVRSAELAARIAPGLLGQDGPRSYLISFETEAELRGTGGLPGAFVIAKADHGKLSFTRFESDSALSGVTSGLDFGPAYDQLYAGAKATQEYSDSNVSPNFPYAAQIWIAMWKKYSGQQLAGAMAIDPTALSYVLKVTGPARLPDGSQVSASNVVALTQRTVYAQFDNQIARKQYLIAVARSISKHLLDNGSGTTGLLRAAGRAASERRIMLWSTDPAAEAELAKTALGGIVAETSAPYLGLSINNAAGNKLDYYVDASLDWNRYGCGATRRVAVTLTVRNDAPSGLPKYVLGRTGIRGYPARPGDNRLLIGYFATHGAQLTGISVNGKQAGAQSGSELGHPVFTVDLQLPRGQTQTVVLNLIEPAGSGSPIVLRQPLVRPLKVSIHDARCG